MYNSEITILALHPWIIQALQTGTPFVYEIFRIGYCIRDNCTAGKYFLYTDGVTAAEHV